MHLTVENMTIRLDDFRLEASLDFPSGELTTLLGPSGCGKTTLLKIIAGLYYPDKGTIRLGTKDITRLDTRYRKIGMVFQDYALFPHMDVQKNICYGMSEKGRSALRKAEELLEMVQLPDYGNRKPDELSGGEKQRVALARALAASPKILLLDEPLSALDAQLRRSLRRQIREIQQQTGITAIYVTHDQEEAMAISDRIVLMDSGRISQIGTPESLYISPANAFAGRFIGMANMLRIQDVLPEKDRRFLLKTEAGEIRIPVPVNEKEGGSIGFSGRYLHFRPENCRIGQPGSSEDLSGTGRIVYREYGGDFLYMEVQSGAGIVRLKTSSSSAYKKGETLSWTVKPEDCLILS